MPPARLFLALWPPAPARAALAAWREAWPSPVAGARPVADERLHLTLHFIGDVAAARTPALRHGLAVAFEPFEFTLDEPQIWARSGVAVLAARRMPDGLHRLHGRLAEALQAMALPVDTRPLRPHVTLWRWRAARAGAGTPACAPPAGLASVTWAVRSYTLVQSLPNIGYRPLADVDAKGSVCNVIEPGGRR